jgi:hypothetical protein
MAGDRPTREDGDQLLELGVVVTVCVWIVDVVVTVSELGLWRRCVWFKVQGSDMWCKCTEMQVVLILF